MSNTDQSYAYPNEQAPSSSGSGKGCLWGCLACFGLFVALLVCAGVGTWMFVGKQVEKYTSETQVELPEVTYTEEQYEELDAKWESFSKIVESDEKLTEDFVLSAEDINAAIGRDEVMKGKVFVKIEDDQVKGDISIPTDKLPRGKGRFFNGSASFDVSMENGVLIVTLDNAEVNGEPVPDEILTPMRQENLAKDFYKDEKNAKIMRQFDSISIQGDKLILKPKKDDEKEEGSAEVDESASGDAAGETGSDPGATSETEAEGSDAGETDEAAVEASGASSGDAVTPQGDSVQTAAE